MREGLLGRSLLTCVRKDLADVVEVCEGALKQTNHLRNLMSQLIKGINPSFTSMVTSLTVAQGPYLKIGDGIRSRKRLRYLSGSLT